MAQRKNRTIEQIRRRRPSRPARILALAGGASLLLVLSAVLWAQSTATDPGVRGIKWCTTCTATVGGFQSGLTTNEIESESAATGQFQTAAIVQNNSNVAATGLGPRFNSNSCASCHAQPALGGSSPSSNPLFQVYKSDGTDTFDNTMPSFETETGPVLIPRLPQSSGGTGLVQQLFTIAGASVAPGCNIQQPNFSGETGLVFRQPLPTYGDGLVEFIENKDILNNLNSNLTLKTSLGIGGVANATAADGSVNRLGWKAQWRAVLPANGAEEQIEEGITNEMFTTEIDQTANCDVNGIPEDPTNYSWSGTSNTPWLFLANPERDAIFIDFLAAPIPATKNNGATGCPGGNLSSCTNGQTQFNNVGCVLCHTTSFTTPPASLPSQGHLKLNLYSDLLLHHMGSCLADNITQGAAQGDMWRTPPLWDVGQRIWFMHDARTNNIVTAIEEHLDGFQTQGCTGVGSYSASEADAVIKNFNALSSQNQQDLVNFLRSL